MFKPVAISWLWLTSGRQHPSSPLQFHRMTKQPPTHVVIHFPCWSALRFLGIVAVFDKSTVGATAGFHGCLM